MKIIATSNFDDENVPDHLVCAKVDDRYARRILEMLNHDVNGLSKFCFCLVPDDHPLHKAP